MADTPESNVDAGDCVSAAALMDNVGQVGSDEDVQKIVAAGPWGALTVAGIAVLGLLVIWFAFFLLVFLPRGSIG